MAHNNSNLDSFFNPKSVAVVGASEKPGKISSIIFNSLKTSGFQGRIYPVNPGYRTIGGERCYPTVSDIDGEVDLAVFAVPAGSTPDALRGAAGKIRGAVIIGGGFAETGEEGRFYEKEVKEIAREAGIRVIGPNCMGIYDTVSKLDTFFISGERIKRPGPGGLSIISQSGSFAITAMDDLAAEGIGIARVISYGNKADVNECDCLDFLADDGATSAVAVYIESIEEGRRFVEAASRCSAKKPVVAVKVGKGGAGASAARSHTGAIAGRYEVYRAAFRKAGVVELDGYEGFIGGCKALSMNRPARGARVVIITDGGGMGVSIADACHLMGLEALPLKEDMREDIQALFPPYFALSNPLDLTGSVTDEMYAEALEKVMAGDYYDIAIVAALWGPPALTDELASMLAAKADACGKPVIICSPGGEYTRKKAGLFRASGLPVFPTPEGAVRAASVLSMLAKSKKGAGSGHG